MTKKTGNYCLKYASKTKSTNKLIPILSSITAFLLILTIGFCIFLPKINIKSNTELPKISSVDTTQQQKITYPTFNKGNKLKAIPKSIKSKNIIIIDKKSNKIIAQKKPHKRVFPASTTKIMTLLVAVENIKNYKDKFEMTFDITNTLYIAEASVVGFSNGEKISMTDLLYGTILPSGADAAIGLAIKVADSEENFVKLMNEKVKELGLKNTHFTNVTGLHHKNNYSSAYDMAIILNEAMKNDLCKEILSTYQRYTAKTKYHPDGILLTSTLFKYMYGTEPKTATILGGKTGYLDESGYCIAAFGEANKTKNEYIIVTLGGKGRQYAFNDQISLFKKFAK